MSDDQKFTTTRTGHMTNSSSSSLRRRLSMDPDSISREPRSVPATLTPSTRLNHASHSQSHHSTNSPRHRTISPSGSAYDNYSELNRLSRDRLKGLLSQYLQTYSIGKLSERRDSQESGHHIASEHVDWIYLKEKPRDMYASSRRPRTLNLLEQKNYTGDTASFADNGTTNTGNRCVSSLSITRSDISDSTPSSRHRTSRNGYTPDSETSDVECRHGGRRWNFRHRETSGGHSSDTAPSSSHVTDMLRDVRTSRNENNIITKSSDIAQGLHDSDGSSCWPTDSSDMNGWTTRTLPHQTTSNDGHSLPPSISWADSKAAKRISMFGSLDRHHSVKDSHCLHDVLVPTDQCTVFNDVWSIATPTSTLKVRSSRSETEKVCATDDTNCNLMSDKNWKMQPVGPSVSNDPLPNGFQTWPRRLRNENNCDEEMIFLVPIGPGIQVLEPESIIRKLQLSQVSRITGPATRVPRKRLLATADSTVTSLNGTPAIIEPPVELRVPHCSKGGVHVTKARRPIL